MKREREEYKHIFEKEGCEKNTEEKKRERKTEEKRRERTRGTLG